MQKECYGYLKEHFLLENAPEGHKYISNVDFFKNVLRDLDVSHMFFPYLSKEEMGELTKDNIARRNKARAFWEE